MKDKITVAIAGLGSRGFRAYATICMNFPEDIEIVAIAEPRAEQMALVRQMLPNIPDDMCFNTAEEMLSHDKLADVMFVCTLDRMHYHQAMLALEKGYDLLLEKPISNDSKQCKQIAAKANELNRKVIVCHVLRYTLFYQKLKEIIDDGLIGDVVCINAIEGVAYWHQAHSFVRGNWNNCDTTSPMILQKSCHDMDIYLWLAGKKAKSVSSFGSLNYFKKDNAPIGAPKQCGTTCPNYDTCIYNPYKFYGEQLEKGNIEWPVDVVTATPTKQALLASLENGPYGRCIYHCDNNVVDHQVVNINLQDNSTISFTMCAFTNFLDRKMTIMGTKGHIEASLDDEKIVLGVFGKPDEIIPVDKKDDSFGHGGGDEGIIESIIRLFKYDKTDSSITSIDRSTESHYVALAAEQSRINGGEVIDLDDYIRNL